MHLTDFIQSMTLTTTEVPSRTIRLLCNAVEMSSNSGMSEKHYKVHLTSHSIHHGNLFILIATGVTYLYLYTYNRCFCLYSVP